MNFIHNIVWISPIRYLRPFQPWNIFAESHSVSCTALSQPVVLSCRKSRTSYLFSKTVKKAEGPSQFLSLCAFQTYKISTSVNIVMKNFEHRNNMKTCREPSFKVFNTRRPRAPSLCPFVRLSHLRSATKN